VTGRWFPAGIPVSSTNKTDRHDITESGAKHHTLTITSITNMSSFSIDIDVFIELK
jgi:hypothetical protein